MTTEIKIKNKKDKKLVSMTDEILATKALQENKKRAQNSLEKNKFKTKVEEIKAENERLIRKEVESKNSREYLNSTIPGHDSWLVHQLKDICRSEEKDLDMCSFRFEKSVEATEWNAEVLESYGNDFETATKNNKNTIISPGSEFRDVTQIRKLWQYRENWQEIERIMTVGCIYPLKEAQDEETRRKDLEASIRRGNHKSCDKPHLAKSLDKNIEKELKRGFIIPLPIHYLHKLKNAGVIPMGMSEQFTINEKGQRVPKPRPCHDASFPMASGYSVNDDHDVSLLSPCQYGQCLRRVIHSIMKMRRDNEETTIYIIKYDFEAAYRRLHVWARHAVLTIIVVKSIAYLLTRLPFGATCGPSRYSEVSEALFDAANDLIEDETWDPDTLRSPYHDKLQPPEKLPSDIAYAKAKTLSVEIPSREVVVDGYIDDSITVILDRGENLKRGQNAIPLLVHGSFRPPSQREPVARKAGLQLIKLQGEGTPAERKIVLGWLLDSRELRIHLPMDKGICWMNDIDCILKENTRVKSKKMEQMIGRLNHVGYIIPQARYFLNRIRRLQNRCEKYGPQKPNMLEKKDLKLWKKFIHQAAQTGISMNLIAFTEADVKICTDASMHGMGGFNPSTGLAWRYELTTWMRKHLHINTIEFISATIGIWLEILHNEDTEYMRINCLTDNSSAVGWLYKANFDPNTHQKHDEIARLMATILLESESALYPQHIPGERNIVADSLSRDFHIKNKHLQLLLTSLFPAQAPKNLRILEKLPNEITLWLESLQDSRTSDSESLPAPAPSKMGALLDGSDSWSALVSKINSWTATHKRPKSQSCQRLRPLFEEMSRAAQSSINSLGEQSAIPSITYVRHSGQTYAGHRF